VPEWLGSGLQNRLHRFNSDRHLQLSLGLILSMKSTRAYAHTNIALIKYWGKLPGNLNLPATGSLSLTLDNFGTETTLSFIENAQDVFVLNNHEQIGEPLLRVQRFLDIVRALGKNEQHCLVDSRNDVPTRSGLASSSSGFAALSVAANQHFALKLNSVDLSQLARVGSGSAARSVFGGFVYMHSGSPVDKTGGYAEVLAADPALDIRLIVVQCAVTYKEISSRAGMLHTSATSPYYTSWIATHAMDLEEATRATMQGDFKTLGELTEQSTLKMHACMLAAKPGFWYFEPLTIAVMNRVKFLRNQGFDCYFTMDAGPHVKVLCKAETAEDVAKEIKKIDGVVQIDIAKPGPGAKLQ
jgi:diphosphomevalonate decarboxylase